MYLVNMQHNQDRELLDRELAHTLGTSRYRLAITRIGSKLTSLVPAGTG